MTSEREINSNFRLGTSDVEVEEGVIDFKVTASDGKVHIGSAYWKGWVLSEESEADAKGITIKSMVQVVIKGDELFDEDICFSKIGGKDLIEQYACASDRAKSEILEWVVANLLDDLDKTMRVDFDGVGSNLLAVYE